MKKILALALIASLCLSACSGTGGESSTSNSSTASSSTSEGTTSSSSAVEQSASSSSTSTTEGALTLEEIKAIFTELDTRKNELIRWFSIDYSKLPIDNVPIRKIENVVVDVILRENGAEKIYGDVVFAKVTEEILPGFPWSTAEEIKNDLLKIYKSIEDSDGGDFAYIVGETSDDNFDKIFYQFDDGLYFNIKNDGIGKYIYWDYSNMIVSFNTPDMVDVFMCEVGHSELLIQRRTIVKNESGNWVIEFE